MNLDSAAFSFAPIGFQRIAEAGVPKAITGPQTSLIGFNVKYRGYFTPRGQCAAAFACRIFHLADRPYLFGLARNALLLPLAHTKISGVMESMVPPALNFFTLTDSDCLDAQSFYLAALRTAQTVIGKLDPKQEVAAKAAVSYLALHKSELLKADARFTNRLLFAAVALWDSAILDMALEMQMASGALEPDTDYHATCMNLLFDAVQLGAPSGDTKEALIAAAAWLYAKVKPTGEFDRSDDTRTAGSETIFDEIKVFNPINPWRALVYSYAFLKDISPDSARDIADAAERVWKFYGARDMR